ncbi:ankyrin repeat [Fusarium sp. NRRL 25303]|nr:ankyrin repeat [Fusarium sp. NRRL 25303]
MQVFESDLQKLRDHIKNVNKEIRLAADQSQHRNIELQRLENEQADRSRRSLSRFMYRTRDDFDRIHRLQVMRSEETERENNQRLLDSLSSYDYIKPLKQARQKRYPKSAEWIFGTDEFKRWVDGTTPGLLWCSGNMGSGKSIVCASVIDYLFTERSNPQSRIVFFFSRFDDSESMRADTILRAIARQLITIQDVSGHTKQALETIQRAPEDISPQLCRLLARLLSREGPPSWVIVDGLDECQREERQKLVKTLKSMFGDGVNAKMFIASRDHANSIFKGASVNLEEISMNCSVAQDGIARLVDQAVQKCLDAEELLVGDQTLINEIKNTLTKHADGMILWVTLIPRHLCSQPNNEKIREAISFKNLPKSLTEIFNRVLDRIISEEKDGIVQALLPWLVAAKQPLTLSQLEECCLVEIDYETKTVHLIHACVQQFFLAASNKPALSKFHIRIQDADRNIGEILVTYLNFNDFKTTLARVRPPLPPIAPDEIWQKALGNEWSWPRILRLSQRIHGHKRRAADIDRTIASCTRVPDPAVQETTILDHSFLAYASDHWLLHSVNFDQEHCQTWSLWKNMLMCGHELAASPVSEEHHQTIDKALVRWATCNKHSALLHIVAASTELIEQHHPALFDYVLRESDIKLLHCMLNTNKLGPAFNSLCCRAAGDGRLEIVKALFEAGVNINMPGFGNWRRSLPLGEAVALGQIKVIEYLLQQGADPDLPIGARQATSLELAAELGGLKGLETCNLLIDAGANLKNTEALMRSCARGHRETIKLLLSAGIDVNAVFPAPPWHLLCGLHDNDVYVYTETTALLEAFSAPEPKIDIIELLIGAGAKEGAQPSGRPGLSPTDIPLGLAAKEGLVEIMHYLLDNGARVNGLQNMVILLGIILRQQGILALTPLHFHGDLALDVTENTVS